MIIDTHTHLTDSVYDGSRHQMISELQSNRIAAAINVGYDAQSSREGIALAERYNNIFAAIGTHPHDADKFCTADYQNYIKWASHPKVVAVGEIGLDYHYDNSPRAVQQEVFIRQLELADRVGLPVILHTREAEGDTLKILDEHRRFINNGLVVHCFSGGGEFALACAERGFYMSFGGAVTYKNNRTAPEAIKAVGLTGVMLETDCPYLAPVPHRGKVNEPKHTVLVAAKLAEWLDMDIDEVIRVTSANARKFFGKIGEWKNG